MHGNRICLDSGGSMVNFDFLERLHNPKLDGELPPRQGPRHHPMPFYVVATIVKEYVRKWFPMYEFEEHYALSADGQMFFGLLILKDPRNDEEGLMVGFRSSVHQLVAIKLVFAKVVFVCDNLCLSGGADSIHVMKKNTANAEKGLRNGICDALDRAMPAWDKLGEGIECMKNTALSTARMFEIMGRAWVDGVFRTETQWKNTMKEIDSPTDEEFKREDFWGFINRGTQALKLKAQMAHVLEDHSRLWDFGLAECRAAQGSQVQVLLPEYQPEPQLVDAIGQPFELIDV
jgi:hypothetical protein